MSKYFQKMTEDNLYGITVQNYLENRTFVSGEKQFADFCSTSYLGLDYREELIEASTHYLRLWGTTTQWARLEADCHIFQELEARIGQMLGYEKVLLSHSISSGCTSNIPAIVGRNALMICDTFLHPVVKTGCKLASLRNSQITKFDVNDLNHLETVLKENEAIKRKFIFVDGVHSLARYVAPIKELQYLCQKYNSWLFIDDAHGFGILGENPTAQNPWGHGGNGVVKFCGVENQRTFYTSSFGKAFCTIAAFTGIPEEFTQEITVEAEQYIFSAPISPSLLGMVHAAMDINEASGNQIREELLAKVNYFINGITSLGINSYHVNNHPAVFVVCGEVNEVYKWNAILMEQGVFAGIRVFPLTPRYESGFRFAITASNTYEQLDKALFALSLCKAL